MFYDSAARSAIDVGQYLGHCLAALHNQGLSDSFLCVKSWSRATSSYKAPRSSTNYYLLLAEYGRCSKLSHRNEWCSPQRNAWDKCSTDIFYVTIDYPNLLNNPFLTQPGYFHGFLNTKSQTLAQCVTTEPQCLFQEHYDLTRFLMGDTLYYLILAKYGRCPTLSHQNKWCSLQRSYTVSKLLNNLPSYTTKGKLREWIVTENFKLHKT